MSTGIRHTRMERDQWFIVNNWAEAERLRDELRKGNDFQWSELLPGYSCRGKNGTIVIQVKEG